MTEVDSREAQEPPQRDLDVRLLELLVCPLSKGTLEYDAKRRELLSRGGRLAYPVRDGIPVMLPSEARQLDPDE